ncbi:MAG: PAS domain S-box protein [Acidobacteriota bacterium]
MAMAEDDEDGLLRSVALQNASSILAARRRAEEELLQTREELRINQERLHAALSAAGTGTFRWNVQTNLVEWDGNLDRLLGLDATHTGQPLETFVSAVHPDDRPAVVAAMERCASGGGEFDMEFRVVRLDRSVHWISDKGKAFADESGRTLYVTGACADVTSRRMAEEALRESEERLRAMFNQAAVGIALAGVDGRFLEMNRKFTEILGYEAAELYDLTFSAITHPGDREATGSLVRGLLAGETIEYSTEKRYLRKDGTEVWSLTSVALLRDGSGQPQRLLGVIEDITARKHTEEALRQSEQRYRELLESERAARSAAERLSEVKDEFLATLSHELRTPLNAILGWSQLLRSGARNPGDLLKGIETIERNARVQTQLIEDLLDMSRITSGKMRLEVAVVHPAGFVDAAIETVQPAADARNILLERVIDETAGPITGDAARLQQVVWNLLSNAIKFTPKGGRVRVTVARRDAQVVIEVADTGVGIKREFIPYLFERFRQADASTTRAYGGLGLGLSIVKRLVELHGGTVAVQSPGEGRGATVTVELPVAAPGGLVPDPGAPKPGSVSLEPHAELSGVTVLVVDDQADARELVQRVLEDAGADVITAAGAAAALDLVETRKPDVLISDIGMPEADGFELLRWVRALGTDRGGRVPAIALTAFARSEDRTRALRAGFAVHVSKPVDPAELVATVVSVAGRATH